MQSELEEASGRAVEGARVVVLGGSVGQAAALEALGRVQEAEGARAVEVVVPEASGRVLVQEAAIPVAEVVVVPVEGTSVGQVEGALAEGEEVVVEASTVLGLVP
jgi:hypothetical protein